MILWLVGAWIRGLLADLASEKQPKVCTLMVIFIIAILVMNDVINNCNFSHLTLVD